ncbi:MAG TPA: hypothetical protein VG345_16605 [Bryobacteraceae bacterium]|nr:hypothetical protein [Bryobacteraceae bacterium]
MQWAFTVAIAPGVIPPWGTGPQSFVSNITIAGASQSVSATLTAAAPALTVVPPGSSITPAQIGPNMSAIYISQNCGTQTNCFTTPADTQIVTDATMTIGSPNVSTGASDPPFTQADVGKRAQGTVACGAVATNPEKCGGSGTSGLGCPDTTIKTVTDAHNIVLNANCLHSSNTSAADIQNRFAWGHTDDTAIASAVAALEARTHGTIYLSCTAFWVEQPAFILTLPNLNVTTRGPYSVAGCPSGTIIVPGFNFNFAACANQGCIWHDNNAADNNNNGYAGGNDTFRDVDIQGLGIDCQSGCATFTASAAADVSSFQELDNVHINGWNWAAPSGWDGVACKGGQIRNFFINAGGINAIDTVSVGCQIQGFGFANNGSGAALLVNAAGTVTSSQNVEYYADSSDGCPSTSSVSDGVIVHAGTFSSFHDGFTEFCVDGGTANLTDSASFGSFIQMIAGTIHAKGSSTAPNGTFAYFFVQTGSTLFDEGGNFSHSAPVINGTLYGSLSVTGGPAVAGDFAASGGFGSTAAFTSVSGDAHAAEFTLTNSGTGQAANPTFTYTYPNNPGVTFSYWQTPSCTAQQIGGTQAIQDFTRTAISKSAVTLQWNGTPTAASTEIVRVSCQ